MAGLGPIGYAAGTPWILERFNLFKALGRGEVELKGLNLKSGGWESRQKKAQPR